MKAILHADGGARGNPGPAGIGVVLTREDGGTIAGIGRGIGSATNNVAEYTALITGLETALAGGVTQIEVLMDSELVVSQVKGEWKIRNDRLRALAVKARSLMNRFEAASISHVAREENTEADRLSNMGMDESMIADEPGAGAQNSMLE